MDIYIYIHARIWKSGGGNRIKKGKGEAKKKNATGQSTARNHSSPPYAAEELNSLASMLISSAFSADLFKRS